MTDDFLWGGISIRKFFRLLLRNFWMVITIIIITFLGLSFVDNQTYTPSYTSTAVVAVYPVSLSYRYHTIENVYNLSSKTEDMSSVFNSDLFQTGFHNQDPSLQDCTIDCYQIPNSDLLVMHATSSTPENAFKGIRAALDYYSQFSGGMAGEAEIKILLGPKEPYLLVGDSKIHNNRSLLCVLSGLMMAGLLLFMYVVRRTYKTEHSIRKRYKNVRFFSLPFMNKAAKKNRQDPMKKLALEIRQVLHKCNKNSLLVTSCADEKSGNAFISALARELAEQKETVILIGTEAWQQDGVPGSDASDDAEKHTLLDILQRKCTVKDAMIYREDLKVQCIPCDSNSIDEDIFYSIDDVRRVLADCQEHGNIVLVNGEAMYPSHYAQIWKEASGASIALCKQEDAEFFEVDKMLSDLQKGDTYFAGCVLFGF